MKRLALGIALAVLPACITTSPVAEEQKSDEQRLSESIDPFCDRMCQMNVDCGFDTAVDCPRHCSQYLSAFVGHGDQCVELGQGLLECVGEPSTCAQLSTVEDCDVDSDLQDQCARSGPHNPGDSVICDVSSGGGTRGAAGVSDPPELTECFIVADNCTDSSTYRVDCRTVLDQIVCNCFQDDLVTGSAFTFVDRCPEFEEINAPCGWNLLI